MAFFAVPSQFEGKTLKQIASEFNSSGQYFPRMDQVAQLLGVSEDTPLRAGMSADINLSPGSGEFQFFKNNFRETTREAEYASQYTKALQDQINKETQWVDKYLKDNPFVFDEELARKSATAEYQPYYSELLQDYMEDVKVKRQNVQDEQKLLRELRQLDVSQKSRSYQYAVENAQEGYAGKGLFGSGMRIRDIGKQAIEYKAGSEASQSRYETAEKGIESTLGQYATDEQRQQRDIGRAQDVAVEGGILQRREEALKPYHANYEQAYRRQFQPGQMSANDYLPASYLRY